MATPQVTPVETTAVVYAGLGRRLAAYVIDLLLVLGLLFMVAFVVRGLRVIGLWAPPDSAVPPDQLWRALGVGPKLLIVLAYFISLGPIYVILFHASGWQATIGKRLTGIYVTDDAGNRLTLSRSSGRWFAQFFVDSFGGGFISLFTVAFSGRKKALHDALAGTLVLKGHPTPDGKIEAWRCLIAFALPFVWMLLTFLLTL